MKASRAGHLIQFPPDLRHTVPDHPPVGFDLRFTGTAEEAETAALPLKVSPAAHQSSGLIVEMGKLHLKPPFVRRRALAENFEDQASAVDDLCLGRLFQIALLYGAQGIIDDDKFSLFRPGKSGDLVHLPTAE